MNSSGMTSSNQQQKHTQPLPLHHRQSTAAWNAGYTQISPICLSITVSLQPPGLRATHRCRLSAITVQRANVAVDNDTTYPPPSVSPLSLPRSNQLSPELLLFLLRSHYPHCDTHTHIYIYMYTCSARRKYVFL